MLVAHQFPHKLHPVGQPMPGHDIRLIDEDGRDVAKGVAGEVVGRSEMMMAGYHNQPEKTARASGATAMDDASFERAISDIEAEVLRHPSVAETAVVGGASRDWGETPVAFVSLRLGEKINAAQLMDWVNARLGKTQRLRDLRIVDGLPRSSIGKVLKRQLRERFMREGR
jgi:long-chain acyl-CoA synthetase